MATYLDICKDVRAQASISGDGPSNVIGQTGIYADIVRWVDEAYNEIQSLHENWNFLHQTYQITLPVNFDEYSTSSLLVRKITDTSYMIQYQTEAKERLIYVPFSTWEATDRFLDGTVDKPTHVTLTPNGTLQFWPKADRDYFIHFKGFQEPDIMTSSADEPVFKKQWHDLIKLLALTKYAEYYNATEVFQSANRNYMSMLKKMQFSELPRDFLYTPTFVPFA